MELGKGEALVSFLEGNGTPSMVERCIVRPPSARLGPITPDERKALMANSPVKGKYDQAVDTEFGLRGVAEAPAVTGCGRRRRSPHRQTPGAPGEAAPSGASAAVLSAIGGMLGGLFGTSRPRGTRLLDRSVDRARSHALGHQSRRRPDRSRHRQSIGGKTGSSVGRAIVRGTMGGILRR